MLLNWKKQDYKRQQSDQTNRRFHLCCYFRDDRIASRNKRKSKIQIVRCLEILFSQSLLLNNQRIQNYGILLDGSKHKPSRYSSTSQSYFTNYTKSRQRLIAEVRGGKELQIGMNFFLSFVTQDEICVEVKYFHTGIVV
jgi:hypothetical protein